MSSSTMAPWLVCMMWAATSIVASASIGDTTTFSSTGAAGSLQQPWAIVAGTTGEFFFVIERNSSIITNVSSAGSSLFAGSGTAGYVDDVSLTEASFDTPSGLAWDPSSSQLFVADTGNNRVRVCSESTGNVTTLAGSGSSSSAEADGTGTDVVLSAPYALAIDTDQEALYVATLYRIVSITYDGVVTTLAAIDPSTSADSYGDYNSVLGLVYCGLADALYYSQYTTNAIYRLELSNASVSLYAGVSGSSGSSNGYRTSATFQEPAGLDVDVLTGTLFVTDRAANTVRKINADDTEGYVVTIASSSNFAFSSPQGIALVSSNGTAYVADTGNGAIEAVVAEGYIESISPSSANVDATLNVTISGSYLGSGSDITSVTICSTATTIVSQSASEVVVTATPAAVEDCSVYITSTSLGEIAGGSFSYWQLGLTVLDSDSDSSVSSEEQLLTFNVPELRPVVFAVVPSSVSDWSVSANSWNASTLLSAAVGDNGITLCNLEAGEYNLTVSVVDSTGTLVSQQLVYVHVDGILETVPYYAAMAATVVVMFSVIIAVYSTVRGVKSGNEMELIYFAQFVSLLGLALPVVVPDTYVNFADGLSWLLFRFPLPWEPTRSGDMPGTLFSNAQPIPTEANMCPRDMILLYSFQVLFWAFSWIVGLVIIAFFCQLFLHCVQRESPSGQISFWKTTSIAVQTAYLPAIAHAARIYSHTSEVEWHQIFVASIAIFVLLVWAVMLYLTLHRRLFRTRRVEYREYGPDLEGQFERSLCLPSSWGYVGEWEAVDTSGIPDLKFYGYLYRKYKRHHGAWALHVGQLLKHLVSGIVIGVTFTYSTSTRQYGPLMLGLLVLNELGFFFYLAGVRPYTDNVCNMLAVGTSFVQLGMLATAALLPAYGFPVRSWEYRFLGTVLWGTALGWLLILVIFNLRWQLLSYEVPRRLAAKRFKYQDPIPLERDRRNKDNIFKDAEEASARIVYVRSAPAATDVGASTPQGEASGSSLLGQDQPRSDGAPAPKPKKKGWILNWFP